MRLGEIERVWPRTAGRWLECVLQRGRTCRSKKTPSQLRHEEGGGECVGIALCRQYAGYYRYPFHATSGTEVCANCRYIQINSRSSDGISRESVPGAYM